MSCLLIRGDAQRLGFLPDGCVQCCVTSPPYFGQRSYLDPADPHKGREIGAEPAPDGFVAALVEVFREVRRVLRDDGTLWVNIGESYCTKPAGRSVGDSGLEGGLGNHVESRRRGRSGHLTVSAPGIKAKDCLGVPWRLALALQSDGWWLRDPIVWAKAEVDEDEEISGSVMPGSYSDRCTFAYEMVFMLAKSERYYFDRLGVTTPAGTPLRNVWRVNTEPSKAGHYAMMPRELARRCIALGTSDKGACPACGAPWRRAVEKERKSTRPGINSKLNGIDAAAMVGRGDGANVTGYRDTRRHVTTYRTLGWEPGCRCDAGDPRPCLVLDPFNGMATTGVAADAIGRDYVGVDLNREYLEGAIRRLDRPHAPAAGGARASDLPGQLNFLAPEPTTR